MLPPRGIIIGKWERFKNFGLTEIQVEEVILEDVVWYPKNVVDDCCDNKDYWERILKLRKGIQIKLVDYILVVKEAQKNKDVKEKKVLEVSEVIEEKRAKQPEEEEKKTIVKTQKKIKKVGKKKSSQ